MSPETQILFDSAMESAKKEGILIFGYMIEADKGKITAFSNHNQALEDILFNTKAALYQLDGPKEEPKIYHA